MKHLIIVLVLSLIFCRDAVAQVGAPAGITNPAAATKLAVAKKPAERRTTVRLASIKSWGYQLQNVDPAEVAASPFDLIVIDYSRNGPEKGRFTPADIKAMQTKPDGSRRYVLAYMSIGEAEEYRFYWDKKWIEHAPLMQDRAEQPPPQATPPQATPPLAGPSAASQPGPKTVRIPRLLAPSWLGRENTRWPGNFLVRYWYDEWQNLIMHHSDSYLSRVLAAGFDGVYLDRLDAFYDTKLDRPFAIEKMVDFVVEFSQIARKKSPGFIVLPQNAEELLQVPRYLAAIDGIAKEDFAFGLDAEGQANSPDAIAKANGRLQLVREADLPVLVVEYLNEPGVIAAADALIRSRQFIPYFAPRKLDRLVLSPVKD